MTYQKKVIKGTVLKIRPTGIQVRVTEESGQEVDKWFNFSKYSKINSDDVMNKLVIGTDVELLCNIGKTGVAFIEQIKNLDNNDQNNVINENQDQKLSQSLENSSSSYENVLENVLSEIKSLRSELLEIKNALYNDISDKELFESASRQATDMVNTAIQYLLSYKDDSTINIKTVIADLKKEALPAQKEIAWSIFKNMKNLPNLLQQWEQERQMVSHQPKISQISQDGVM